MFESFTIILSLSALFSYINHKWLRLPTTIGLMIMAFLLSIPISLLEIYNEELFQKVCEIILQVDFRKLLLDILLSILLFAGALHVRIKDLQKERATILLFATLGVIINTLIVGCLTYYGLMWMGHSIALAYCFLFGALIAPTDPIAVLATLRDFNVSDRLKVRIQGEALFNDGVGVVVFVTIMSIASGAGDIQMEEALSVFGQEALGGIAYGLLLGYGGLYLLKSIDDAPKIDILVSLALILGGYSFASLLHVSGPLAMVVTGLLIGQKLHTNVFKKDSKIHLRVFWNSLDEVLNALLFVLIGLEILVLGFEWHYLTAGILAIFASLFTRWVTVTAGYNSIKGTDDHHPSKTALILTWGGLKGAISIALALSLQEGEFRDIIVFMTYSVVVFTVIVQGLTLKPLLKKLNIKK